LKFLRKEEFCSASHRVSYNALLGKALGAIKSTKDAPAPVAAFASLIDPCQSNLARAAFLDLLGIAYFSPRMPQSWPLAIPVAGSGHREPAAMAATAAPADGGAKRFAIWPRPPEVVVRAPHFAIAADAGFMGACEADLLRATPRAGAAPSLEPAPVACLVLTGADLEAAATALPVSLRTLQPMVSITGLARLPRHAALVAAGAQREYAGGVAEPRKGATVLPFQPVERLPRFDVTACFEPLAVPVETAPRPPASEAWMTSPPAAPAARMVLAAMADAVSVPLREPLMAAIMQSCPLPAAPLRMPECRQWQPYPQPGAVLVDATPGMISDTAVAAALRLPAMPFWQAKDALRGAHAGAAKAPAPAPVESFPAVEACTPLPAVGLPRLCLPVPALAVIPGRVRLESAETPGWVPSPVVPFPAAARVVLAPVSQDAPIQPRMASGGLFAGGPARRRAAALRPATFVVLDFHCRPKAGVAAKPAEWTPAAIGVIRPRPSVRPLFDRWEDLAPPARRSQFGFGRVVAMSRALRHAATSKYTRHMVGAAAAGLLVGASLWFWFGGGNGRNARETASEVAINEIAPTAAPVKRVPSGPVAKVRHAIEERAAVSWSDSFHGGMEAWGAGAKSWAPGWTRSADGYVQPGSLAIFRPTVGYTDYTLEFFGQIERKSMDWVVRARDSKNYYAMKFTVVRPGARPVVALAHYAVVAGKRVGYTETPLDIMVHNSRPMQVLVDVKGNHFSASVDGEEVGSWTDNGPSTGGVGFFAEAGEKARLYWMKVSRNQDFLGRVCSYLSGSPSVRSAGLYSQDPEGRPRPGGSGTPFEPAETLGVAAIVALRRSRMRTLALLAAPNFAERRVDKWSL